jgi:hypothetical protein
MDSTDSGHCGVVGQCVHGNVSFTKILEDLLVRWETISFLTLILLTWRIGWATNNASRWQMGFNSAFKELRTLLHGISCLWSFVLLSADCCVDQYDAVLQVSECCILFSAVPTTCSTELWWKSWPDPQFEGCKITYFRLFKIPEKHNIHSFIHSVFCLTTGSKPPPKRFLHIVQSRASSFKLEYPLLSLRSSSSFLRLLPRLLVTSISPFIFPSITCFRRHLHPIKIYR